MQAQELGATRANGSPPCGMLSKAHVPSTSTGLLRERGVIGRSQKIHTPALVFRKLLWVTLLLGAFSPTVPFP